jgi:hypothetical protein
MSFKMSNLNVFLNKIAMPLLLLEWELSYIQIANMTLVLFDSVYQLTVKYHSFVYTLRIYLFSLFYLHIFKALIVIQTYIACNTSSSFSIKYTDHFLYKTKTPFPQ